MLKSGLSEKIRKGGIIYSNVFTATYQNVGTVRHCCFAEHCKQWSHAHSWQNNPAVKQMSNW
jgi:hypothetical protein